jgi:type I restriction enzyme S subunit
MVGLKALLSVGQCAFFAALDENIVPGAFALTDFAELRIGYAFKSDRFLDSPTGLRLLRGINIGVRRTRWAADDTVYWAENETEGLDNFTLAIGDFVIPMDRPFTAEGVLRWARLSEHDVPSLLVQRVARLRPRDDEGALMVQGLLHSPKIQRLLVSRTTGSFVPHLAHGDFSHRVFEILDTNRLKGVVTKGTNLLNSVQAEIASLKSLQSSLLRECLRGDVR